MQNNILNNKLKWSLTLLLLLFLTLPFACETILNEATITGTVVNGETTQPVEGAFIRAIGFSESVETDSAGAYELLLSIEDPEIDAVTLEISKSGFLADTLLNIGLELGGTTKAPPSNLIPISTSEGQVVISGYVINAITKNNIDSAFVKALEFPAISTTTGSDGKYNLKLTVDADDSSSVTIEVSKGGFLPDTISNVGFSFIDTVVIRTANLIPITIEGGLVSLSGKVFNLSTSETIYDANITVMNHSESAKTDSMGEYFLTVTLLAGQNPSLTLIAWKEGFKNDTLSNVGVAINETVEVPPIGLVPIAVTQGIATLEGKVVNGLTKAPIEGALIRVDSRTEIVSTDITGAYLLNIALAAGDANVVDLTVGKAGFLTSTIPNVGLSIGETLPVNTANLIPIDPDGAFATVKGRLLDEVFGSALEGVEVKASGHDESVLSNASGYFELVFVVEFDDTNVVDLSFSLANFIPDTLTDVLLNVGGSVGVSNVLLTPEESETTLSGRVIDAASGDAISGVIVRALGRGETTTTDFRGEYELPMILSHDDSEVVSFDFFKIGFLPDTLIDLSLTRGITNIASQVGLTAEQTVATVTGTIEDNLGGDPVEDALIRILGSHLETATTNSRGDFSLPITLVHDETNIVSLEISKDNFASDTLLNVTLTRGGTFDTGITILNIIFADAVITGNVTNDLDGKAVEGATIRVFGHVETTTTDFRGEFSLPVSISNAMTGNFGENLGPLNKSSRRRSSHSRSELPSRKNFGSNPKRRIAQSPGNIVLSEVVSVEISMNNFISDTLTNVTLTKGQTVNTGETVLTIIDAIAIATGNAIDDINGLAIENATIRVFGRLETTTTDFRGEYILPVTIRNDESNIVTIEVSKDNFIPDTLANFVLIRGGSVSAGLSILTTIDAAAIVTGNVIDDLNSIAIENATIRVFGRQETTTTDSRGDYSLPVIIRNDESNIITIEVFKDNFIPDTLSNVVLIRDGSVNVGQSILTTIDAAAIVTGNVIDDLKSEPLENATVRVFGRPETAITDFRGEYILPIIVRNDESNIVTIEISKDNFMPDTVANIVLIRDGSVSAGQSVLNIINSLTTVSGNITDAVSSQPINGALVTAIGHIEATLSNTIGDYSLPLLLKFDKSDTVSLKITKSGFVPDTLVDVPLIRGGSVVAPALSLIPLTSEATFNGRVVDAIIDEEIEDASIRVLGHEETASSDFKGEYRLTIDLAHDESDTVQVEVSKTGFIPDTLTNVVLTRDGSITVAKASLSPEVRAGPAASVSIASVTANSIAIQGAGAAVNTDITFQIFDASGIPLDKYRPTEIAFSLSGPGGGEFVDPDTATTDESGIVQTTLNSGTLAGPVQVIATIAGQAISSLPVPISIHGGLPDLAHFTVFPSTLNIAGLVSMGREATITAFVGDKFSNIVPPGTSVQFQSNYGLIGGSAVTDESGQASVLLISANPLPLTADSGFVTITGETIDENGTTISTTGTVLFSGHTRVEMVGFASDSSFTIPDGEKATFTVKVDDQEFGNPIEGGSTIEITTTAGAVSGSVTIPDTQSRGPKTTLFNFTLRDTAPGEDPPAPPQITTVRILVTSPNGNVDVTITGTVD